MSQQTNPEDVYKYLNVPYSQKDHVKDLNPDAIAFDGDKKKWFIKSDFAHLEDEYKKWQPQSPSSVENSSSKRSRDQHHVTPSKKSKTAPILSGAVVSNSQLKEDCREGYCNCNQRWLFFFQSDTKLEYPDGTGSGSTDGTGSAGSADSTGFILMLHFKCLLLIVNLTQRESWSPKMSVVEYWSCKKCFKR